MKLFRTTYLCLVCVLLTSAVYAQIDSTAVDSVRQDTAVSVNFSAGDTLQPAFKVYPWKYRTTLEAELTSTDSTLRWEVWPNWVYKKNRDPGVITYRLGTIGRTNAMLIQSHEPRHQRLLWEDVSLNDPVSGIVNWDVIPLHKVRDFYEDNEGIRHESNYYLKQYYLNKPLSQLIYKESKFNYRSLEFLVSQNFGAQTNAEISYWDRRDGGEFPNSEVGGRQVFARVFHQLDHRQALKVNFLNNSFTIAEPFGYGINDLTGFHFSRYHVNPDQLNAESEVAASNIFINYYRRSGDTTHVDAEDFRAGLFFNSRERSLTYNIDSTYYKVQSVGANAHKWLDLDPVLLEGRVTNEWFFNKDRSESSLEYGNWNLLKGYASVRISPVPFWKASGTAEYQHRSDGFNAYTLRAGSGLQVGKLLSISGELSRGTIMPTPQQLYWSSLEYQGNSDLESEQVTSFHGEVTAGVLHNLAVGVKGQLKDIKNGIMVEGDSVFANVAAYNSASASAYFDYNSKYLELTGSATYHRFGHFLRTEETPLPVDGFERVWIKGGAHIKGYVFHRAAFVKVGLSGMISPLRYKAAHYNPVLDYWQAASDDQYLPTFDRLDLDISARVRTIMFTLRWENVLDDVSQLGYFETARYPMGQRRFIFGVRALFRD